MVNFRTLLDFLGADAREIVGMLPDDFGLHLSDAASADEHTLDWCANPERCAEILAATPARAVIIPAACNATEVTGKTLIRVDDPKATIARIGNAFFVKRETGIHPTAVIEAGAEIGKDCYLGPHVVVHGCVKIGDNVRIKAGAVIGNEGFGFVRDEKGNLIRFPQIGRVLIGDGVEIGSNSTIDRGALSDTVIGRDVKINNLVHIAHNVKIGEHTVITAQVNVSGSSVIGKNVWLGPGTTVRDHVTVGDGAYIGIGSNVVKDIPSHEVWCGNPARKLR